MAAEIAHELFFMSPPGPGWRLRGRANFRSAQAPSVDAAKAFSEWQALAAAIEAAGGRVVALAHDDEMTGLPYCAEAGHPLPPTGADPRPVFLLPRMWAEHRQDEWTRWAPLTEAMGFRTIRPDAGYWEGQGDVAEFRGTTLLFCGGRTDADGLRAVRSWFPDDALTIGVRQPAFHGNVAVLPVDSCDRLLVCPELVTGDGMALLSERFGPGSLIRLSVEEARAYATNALPIGDSLLAPSIAPRRLLSLLAELGMRIVELDMGELCEKAGGASRCLVCRVPSSIARLLDVSAASVDRVINTRSAGEHAP